MKHLQLTDDLQGQASLFVAGALPESERAEYARHLEGDQCAVCRAEVNELQAAMTMLAFSVPSAMPSIRVKMRLLEQARNSYPVEPRQPFFRRRWIELITSAAAVAAIIVTISALQANRELRRLADVLSSRISQLETQLFEQRTYIATLTSPEVRVVNLAGQGTNVGASGRIFWDQARKRWFFYVRDLPRLSDNLSYQLWFVPRTGNPVSATVFNTESNGSAEVPISLPEGATALKAAAVTTEPAGGLPQPSGAFALLGAAE